MVVEQGGVVVMCHGDILKSPQDCNHNYLLSLTYCEFIVARLSELIADLI